MRSVIVFIPRHWVRIISERVVVFSSVSEFIASHMVGASC